MLLFWRSTQKFLGHSGATMIELMAVLAIMGMGIAAMLATIGSGIDYAKDTEDNIKAINLAREGIEWVINIRDTNWLRFSSDVTNCWRVMNYGTPVSCIGNPWATSISVGSYILSPANGLWYLSGASTNPTEFSTNWSNYASKFKVGQDAEGFFTQSGVTMSKICNVSTGTGCLSIFTREIQVKEITTDKLEVSSIVRWKGKRPREVIIKTILTNWKKNF